MVSNRNIFFLVSALGGVVLNVGTLVILLGGNWDRSYLVLTHATWGSIVAPNTFLPVVLNLAVNATLFAIVLSLARRRMTSKVAFCLSVVLTLLAFWQMFVVNLCSAVLMGLSALAAKQDRGHR